MGKNGSFDRVELRNGPDGEVQHLTRAQFDAMPLDQRVRAILRKHVRFFDGDREVPARQALGDR